MISLTTDQCKRLNKSDRQIDRAQLALAWNLFHAPIQASSTEKKLMPARRFPFVQIRVHPWPRSAMCAQFSAQKLLRQSGTISRGAYFLRTVMVCDTLSVAPDVSDSVTVMVRLPFFRPAPLVENLMLRRKF